MAEERDGTLGTASRPSRVLWRGFIAEAGRGDWLGEVIMTLLTVVAVAFELSSKYQIKHHAPSVALSQRPVESEVDQSGCIKTVFRPSQSTLHRWREAQLAVGCAHGVLFIVTKAGGGELSGESTSKSTSKLTVASAYSNHQHSLSITLNTRINHHPSLFTHNNRGGREIESGMK
ncbi:hypothetical protein JR316_0003061 [Psilocybe cubensis]|uniref:Uncharacterized protein n=1 Tax=Psilocybe cubensis TaxID=181762 RepID=A0ACB8H6Q7_PSICU|nr:hypothetical protein JR316_0003061 [Psilocybe cubensis]KAH9483591.1 hypothetical protein JR316_0003061 [Psilocybe cubensis]